jgi:hypothetical protein
MQVELVFSSGAAIGFLLSNFLQAFDIIQQNKKPFTGMFIDTP